MEGKTLALWVAPGILILFGVVVAFRVVRGRMALSLDDAVDDPQADDRP
jgi:cytochrome c-type biogenesis protein CcmH/NrfF